MVVMCSAGLPSAIAPLWQTAHGCVTPAWSKRAGLQAVVVWQSPHAAVVGRWFAGLPGASEPLWQLWQLPVTSA